MSILCRLDTTGEMSNQIWDDLVKIYKVAAKLKLWRLLVKGIKVRLESNKIEGVR